MKMLSGDFIENEKEKAAQIKLYWDDQAQKHGADMVATTPDFIARGLEIKNILHHLRDDTYVLDAGCGNGYSTIEFAKNLPNIKIVGIDYSEKMIEVANTTLNTDYPLLKDRVRFEVMDILNLSFEPETFDTVITERCLINLASLDRQLDALKQIYRILKKGGIYVMCENTKQGLDKLNELRKRVSLYEIPVRWHNIYIDENLFFDKAKQYFQLIEVNNFSSLYYIISRVFNAKLAAMEGKEPDYKSPINLIAAELPSIGDCGQLKIFILKK